MSYPGGWRPHIEGALVLNIGCLIRFGALRDGARGSLTWRDSYGDERGGISYATVMQTDSGALTLLYSLPDRETDDRKSIQCFIRLSSLPLHYGGRRWYMHCPYTGRRALKLYKFSGIEQFCHRTAIRPLPTYASQRVSGINRVIEQRWAIRRKLGDKVSDLFGEPMRPKWIRWRTYERYAARDAELSARENSYFLSFFGRSMLNI